MSHLCFMSILNVLDDLGWRSFESKWKDARLKMFNYIIQGNVAIQVPLYLEIPAVPIRHIYPLAFRRVHIYASYYVIHYI